MMTQVNKKKYLELDESQIKGKRDPGHFLGPIIIKRFKKLIKKKNPKPFAAVMPPLKVRLQISTCNSSCIYNTISNFWIHNSFSILLSLSTRYHFSLYFSLSDLRHTNFNSPFSISSCCIFLTNQLAIN